MRIPDRLQPLLDHGVIEEVVRPLMSGKEAEVFLVVAEGEERVAKVYKNAQFRSFQNRAEYTEGRRVRNSRQQRAMAKGSRHGRAKTEEAWQSAEVDAIGRLRSMGVAVPQPHAFSDGVLVMELVRGADGQPAPRLVDTHFTPQEAADVFHFLLREVVKMLCAGIIHGDLSDFNVLMSVDGPVIIDFPQAVDPANNRSAKKLLLRDVKNLTSFLARSAPSLRGTAYGPEMWALYERSELFPDTELTGRYEGDKGKADVSSLLDEIMAIEQEARERREALGLPPPRPARRPVPRQPPPAPKPPPKVKAKATEASPGGGAPKKRRRRRSRGASGGANAGGQGGGPSQGGAREGRSSQGVGSQGRSSQGGGSQEPPRGSGSPSAGSPQNPGGVEAPSGSPKRRRRRRRGPRSDGGGPPNKDKSGD